MVEIPSIILGGIALPKLNTEPGLKEVVASIQNALSGRWGRCDERGKVVADPRLSLNEVLTQKPFYGDYRSLWREGATRFFSEHWTLHLITSDGNKHQVSIGRCEGLPYNELFIAADLTDSTVRTYLRLALSLYVSFEPYYLFVDAPENLPGRKEYETGRLPLFWANWYGPKLVQMIGVDFLLKAPVHEAKSLVDGGVFLQVSPSLRIHLQRGWSDDFKRYFRGKRVQWAKYEDFTGFIIEERNGILHIRPVERRTH
jgi:hypothetical protein